MTRRDSDHRGYYICFDCESHIRQGDKSQVVSRTVEKVSKNGAKFKVLY